jgi:hypothetical protein
MGLKDWFKEPPPRIERKGKRHPAPRFEVIHPSGESVKPDEIKDISATGVYLLTDEPWQPGTHVPVTLHRKSQEENDNGDDFTIDAKVVRRGNDGAGLSFELPADIDPKVWVSLVEGASGEAGPDDLTRPFKTARAVAFLNRVCPDAERDFRRRICSDLSTGRFNHVVDVMLKAERILASWPDGETMKGSAKLLVSVLEYGSWAEDGWIQEYWASLMALACTPERNEEELTDFLERVSQFASIHFRMFSIACDRATKELVNGVVVAQRLPFTSEELLGIGISRDLGRMEREFQHLYALGLYVSNHIPSSYLPSEQFNLAPTSLGLELYARFHAHRGTVESYYGLGVKADGTLAKA